MEITIDFETIPTQLPELQQYICSEVKAPANYKDQEKIDAYIEEAKKEALEKASFDGCYNHIVVMGIAFDDEPADAFHIENVAHEKEMIRHFYDVITKRLEPRNAPVFIGHNISGFDFKVLKQRSMILGVKPPFQIPFESKPWDKNPYDTMVQWDGKNFVKLDKLATAFSIDGKTMDGSQVYKMWLAGQYEALREYCKDDVELTRKVYKRMNFLA